MALVPTQISCSFSLQGLFAGVFLASEFSAAVVARLAGLRFSVEYFLNYSLNLSLFVGECFGMLSLGLGLGLGSCE